MRRLALLLPFLLAACSFGAPRHAQTTYVLEVKDIAPVASTPAWPGTLLVRDMAVSAFYQNAALAFSREPGTRGYYQYARLNDQPGSGLAAIIARRLAQTGLFQGVVPLGQGVTGSWQLNLNLIDFYHDATRSPGSVKLVYEAELVRRDSAQIMARKHIETSSPAASFDAKGAAAAANVAIADSLDQLAAWLQEQAPRSSSAAKTEAR